MYACMFFVGLIGGVSYANTMYQIINSVHLKKSEKDLAIMLTCVLTDVSILMAMVVSLILSNSLFQNL
jgi:hypothetical protein